MTFRVIDVELRAQDASYIQGLNRAAGETRSFVRQVEESGRAASTAYTGATKSTQEFGTAQTKAGATAERTGQQVSDAGHKAGEGMDHAGQRARLAGTEVESATHRMAAGLKGVAETALGFEAAIGFNEAVTKIRSFTVEAVKEGINLNVSIERTRTIFGTEAGEIIRDVERMGETFGTNNAAMLRTVDTFGVVARGAGLTGTAAAELATSLTHVTADTAAFWRQSPDQVMTAIRGGLLGMTRGIKAYGVELNATNIAQKAQQLGLVQAGQTLTEGEKVQARAALIQEQLSNTTGYLAKNTETFAGQLRLLRGHLANFVEEAGSASLPVLASMLLEARHLGQEALPELDRAIQALSPSGRGLVSIGEDLWKILLQLGHAVAPLAGALAGIASAALIAGLNLVIGALSAVTHFLADHEEIIIGVAAIYGATLVPRVLALGNAFLGIIGLAINAWFAQAADGATALATAEGLATAASAGMTLGIGLLVAESVRLADQGKKSGKALADGIYTQPAASLIALRGQITETGKLMNQNKPESFLAGLGDVAERGVLPALKHEHELSAAHGEAAKQLQAHETAYNNWSSNLTVVASTVGTTTARVERLATATGVDLTKSLGESVSERQRLIDDLTGTTAGSGKAAEAVINLGQQSQQMAADFQKAVVSTADITKLSTDQIVTLFGADAQAVTDFGTAVQQAMDTTAKAWSGDADVISSVSQQLAQDTKTRESNAKAIASAGTASSAAEASANDQLLKAHERLSAVEDSRSRKKHLTVADDNALADAKRNLTKATDAVASANKSANTTEVPDAVSRVTGFYKDAIAQATGFSKAINEATQRGVDPQLIARLLEAGPKTAGPVLDAMLSDHSGRIIQMVNDSETALSKITAQAVEMTRLTAIAVKAPTDKIAADLKTAMQAAQLEAANGGQLTAQALADKLKLGLTQVQDIMGEYGITVAEGVNPVLAAVGAQQLNITGSFVTPGHGGAADPKANAWGGFYEDHSPVIARGGPSRIWNEPETGGEAYIPLAPAKRSAAMPVLRQVASEFGVRTYADGGINPPPSFGGMGSFGVGAHDADEKLYEAAERFLSTQAGAAGGMGGIGAAGPAGIKTGKIGHGWPALVAFLSSFHDPFTVTSTTGGKHAAGSLHYRGLAADFVGPNMLKLFNDFATDAGDLQELFFTPAGYSLKNGRRVAPIAAGEHYNHVHAASYDQGGMLPPGLTMAWNGTGRPEPIGHTDALAAAIGKEVRAALAAMPRGPLIGQQVFEEKIDPKHVAHETANVVGW